MLYFDGRIWLQFVALFILLSESSVYIRYLVQRAILLLKNLVENLHVTFLGVGIILNCPINWTV